MRTRCGPPTLSSLRTKVRGLVISDLMTSQHACGCVWLHYACGCVWLHMHMIRCVCVWNFETKFF